MNESRIQLKRKYTETYPAHVVREWAPVRNRVIERVATGKISIDEFDAVMSEMSAAAKKWVRNNTKYFKIEEDGVSLSKYGLKILAQIKPINEMNLIHTSFDSFITESYNPEVELNEAFKSSKLAALLDLKIVDRNIIKGLYGFTKVKLDQITDDELIELMPHEAYKSKRPNALFFYIVDNEKENPYADRDSMRSTKVIPANTLLAIADGNNNFYGLDYGSRWSSDKSLKLGTTDGDGVGVNKKYRGFDASGLYNVKRIADVADRVLVFDWSAMPTSTEERDARAAAKAGAVAFMNDKEFKAENMKRYKEILVTRASNDDIDGIIEKSIETLTKHISDAMKNKTMGRYNDLIIGLDSRGREIKISDASNMIKNILDLYSRYVDYIKQGANGDSWYMRDAKQYAKDIVDKAKKIEKKDYAW